MKFLPVLKHIRNIINFQLVGQWFQKQWFRLKSDFKKLENFVQCLPPKGQLALKTGGICLMGYLVLKAAAWMIPLPEESLWRPSSTLVFDRNGQLLHAFISPDEMWRIQTPLNQVSPYLQESLLGFEDRWFYLHPGVNPLAIARAMIQNYRSHKITSGGSTITMQIARMMEPKKRTAGNKFVEMLRAFQLELRYSKRQLLEIYFNIAPYGGNIEGVAAASWLYFGKEPSQLSLSEAALLTAIPNSPNANRPGISPQSARNSRTTRNNVLKRLLGLRKISRKAYDEAIAEETSAGWQGWPDIAPHFCRDLYLKYIDARLYSTLDRKVQATAEDLLRIHLDSLKPEGISNGAIVVLDNVSHEVLAMVGSADFNDRYHDGQVNGALAPRSPGSALKPFIYALAFQKGMISPAHYLEDVPTDFTGYAPENYDRGFSGIVQARAALERSLNLPAVDLEHNLGEDGLYSLLKRAGVSSLRSKNHYGLSIAIGGCEINLLDISSLYSGFANGGEYVKPRQLKTTLETAGVRLFDPGTAYLITDILTGVRRPDLPTCWEFTSLPQVAWKTGTSYGHRDAWSIGYNPRYTVGVWLGNFSGEGARNLVGAEVAAPILFEMMNSICRSQQIRWFSRPDSVDVREVCNISGQVPGPNCPNLINELYLTDRSPEKTCEVHKTFPVDLLTGYRLPPDYTGNRKYKMKTFLEWPARVGSWMESNHVPIDRLPPLMPDWQGLLPGTPPQIRSPSLDCEYQLRGGIPLENQKICCDASVGSDVHQIFWFLDGNLAGTVAPGEQLFILPIVGRHRLICQDDLGRSTGFTLTVEKAEY